MEGVERGILQLELVLNIWSHFEILNYIHGLHNTRINLIRVDGTTLSVILRNSVAKIYQNKVFIMFEEPF